MRLSGAMNLGIDTGSCQIPTHFIKYFQNYLLNKIKIQINTDN